MPQDPDPTSPQHPLEIGLVLRRPPRLLAIDPFYAELVSGMEHVLARLDGAVLIQVVPDLAAEERSYRRFAASGRISAVILVDQIESDGRAELLGDLGLPALVLGELDPPAGMPAVQVDNVGPMRDAVTRLCDLGHRRIGRVSGPRPLLHTRARTATFESVVEELGLAGVVVEGDYTEESGARATRMLLESAEPPTAIIFDNDLMAVAGLAVADELGFSVPGQVSLLAWDDSARCRLAEPPLSAMSRDVHALGEMVAQSLLALLAGAKPTILTSPAARFIERGSIGPAR